MVTFFLLIFPLTSMNWTCFSPTVLQCDSVDTIVTKWLKVSFTHKITKNIYVQNFSVTRRYSFLKSVCNVGMKSCFRLADHWLMWVEISLILPCVPDAHVFVCTVHTVSLKMYVLTTMLFVTTVTVNRCIAKRLSTLKNLKQQITLLKFCPSINSKHGQTARIKKCTKKK